MVRRLLEIEATVGGAGDETLEGDEISAEEGGEVTRENEDGETGENIRGSTNHKEREEMSIRRLQMEIDFRREQAAWEERKRQDEKDSRREEMEHELQLARIRAETRRDGQEEGIFYKAKTMVPKFTDSEPDDFFAAFEEVAQSLGWQEGKWSLLAQTAFSGKSLNTYLSLDDEVRKDYKKMKEEVLKAYEVTPEHYRSKFRAARRGPGQLYAEFAHMLERNLTKWWRAVEANTMEKMKQTVLLEQFLQGVEPDVKLYLCKQRVRTVAEASSMAQDFSLMTKSGREPITKQWREMSRVRTSVEEASLSPYKPPTRCLKCGIQGHLAWQCRSTSNTRNETSVGSKCFTCGQVGHLSPSCPQKTNSSK